MKKILYIIVIFLMCFGCKEKYIIKNDKVYKQGWNEGVGNYEYIVEGADFKTFENLDFDDINLVLGKDKDNVFMDGKIIQNCDPRTFNSLGDYYFKDKNSIYFLGFYSSEADWKIDSIIPTKFRIIKYPWATDGKVLIWGSHTLQLKDLKSFTPINENWGKTKNEIINEYKILKNVDYSSFKVIDDYSAVDKNGEVKTY